MKNYLSRLDYLDGLGTLSERAAFRQELERSHVAHEKKHYGFVILRRTVTVIAAAIVTAFVTLAVMELGSFLRGLYS